MTLIVANCDSESISIVSDTALSRSSQVIRSRPWDGTLKAIVIGHDICICYAGIAEFALEAIHKAKNSSSDLDDILTILLDQHLQLSQDSRPDFIVASLRDSKPGLYKIQKGQIERNLPTYWIGSYQAFEAYQNLFHKYKDADRDKPTYKPFFSIRVAMFKAMEDVIDNELIETFHPPIDDGG